MPPKTTITTKILIAMVIGLLTGSLINAFGKDAVFIQTYLVDGLFYVVGAAFVNALKMLVVPLVTFSLICGVCGIGDVSVLGRVGLKTLALFILTTAIAVTLALSVAALIGPGKGFANAHPLSDFTPPSAPPVTDVLINIVPGNPVQAFAEGDMLQIIFFVIVFAIAMLMTGDTGRQLAQSAEKMNEVMMKVVNAGHGFRPGRRVFPDGQDFFRTGRRPGHADDRLFLDGRLLPAAALLRHFQSADGLDGQTESAGVYPKNAFRAHFRVQHGQFQCHDPG